MCLILLDYKDFLAIDDLYLVPVGFIAYGYNASALFKHDQYYD
jgi:hypothetical protein